MEVSYRYYDDVTSSSLGRDHTTELAFTRKIGDLDNPNSNPDDNMLPNMKHVHTYAALYHEHIVCTNIELPISIHAHGLASKSVLLALRRRGQEDACISGRLVLPRRPSATGSIPFGKGGGTSIHSIRIMVTFHILNDTQILA
jgi:hypothetical protein